MDVPVDATAMETFFNLAFPAMAGLGLGVVLLLFVSIIRQFLIIGRPNELLIFFGRSKETELLMGGGRRWRRRATATGATPSARPCPSRPRPPCAAPS